MLQFGTLLAQAKMLYSTEMCPQLPSMVNQHFESLLHMNRMLRADKNLQDESDVLVRRLLEAAEEAADNDRSAIVRYFPDANVYMADPAEEDRIRRIKT
jgi:hypothetical protein